MILSHLTQNQQIPSPSASASVVEENKRDLTKEEDASFMDAWSEEDTEIEEVEDVAASVKFEADTDVANEDTDAQSLLSSPIAALADGEIEHLPRGATPHEKQDHLQPEKELEVNSSVGNPTGEPPIVKTSIPEEVSGEASLLQVAVNAGLEASEGTLRDAMASADTVEPVTKVPPSDAVIPTSTVGAEPHEIATKLLETGTAMSGFSDKSGAQMSSTRRGADGKSLNEIETEPNILAAEDGKQVLSEPVPLPTANAASPTIATAQAEPIAALGNAFQTRQPYSFETAAILDRTDPPLLEEENQDIGLSQTGMTQLSPSGAATAGTVRMTHPTVVQQIAAALSQSSGQSTQIALNPEELGRVRISLSSSEAGLVVNIVAERPETADLMRRNISSLLQDFSDLGYENPTFNFQDDENNEGGNTSDTPDTSAQTSDGITAEVSLNTPLPSDPRMTATGGLDLKL